MKLLFLFYVANMIFFNTDAQIEIIFIQMGVNSVKLRADGKYILKLNITPNVNSSYITLYLQLLLIPTLPNSSQYTQFLDT